MNVCCAPRALWNIYITAILSLDDISEGEDFHVTAKLLHNNQWKSETLCSIILSQCLKSVVWLWKRAQPYCEKSGHLGKNWYCIWHNVAHNPQFLLGKFITKCLPVMLHYEFQKFWKLVWKVTGKGFSFSLFLNLFSFSENTAGSEECAMWDNAEPSTVRIDSQGNDCHTNLTQHPLFTSL